MPEKEQLYIPWEEKKKEFAALAGDENIIAQAWTINENLVFFFMWWLGTY